MKKKKNERRWRTQSLVGVHHTVYSLKTQLTSATNSKSDDQCLQDLLHADVYECDSMHICLPAGHVL